MRRSAVLAALLLAITVLPAAGAGASGHLGACGDEYTPIYDIQGSGYVSPLDGDYVVTEGIVTADFQAEGPGGFFVQDRFGDDNKATSDGVFVYHKASWTYDVAVGDYIRFEAKVSEYYGQTQLGSIYGGDLIFCPPAEMIEPTIPSLRRYNKNTEAYEGMLLRFPRHYRVTDTYNLKYGEIWLSQKSVVEQPTNQFVPGKKAEVFGPRNISRTFMIDLGGYSAVLDTADTLRLGDSARDITGAIGYGFSKYRVLPVHDVEFTSMNARPGMPDVEGDLIVGSFNVLNFFTTLGERGAKNPAEYDVQLEKLVDAMLGMGADILAFQEIENSDFTIMALVDALNAAEGSDVWAWVGPAPQNDYPIRNEIVYRSDVVDQIGLPMTLADPAFDTIRPGDGPGDEIGRRPLAQLFEYDGERFTIVVNHFKSKGSPCDSIGDPNLDDGQGNCNATRVWQAEVVLDFVDYLVAEHGDPDVLVVGDLNAYLKEDPVRTLEGGLMNLVKAYDRNPYSYNYFNINDAPWIGRGLLDHALGTYSMADQVVDAMVWHINADEPRLLDWWDEWITAPGPYRSSDHDPVLIGLELGG